MQWRSCPVIPNQFQLQLERERERDISSSSSSSICAAAATCCTYITCKLDPFNIDQSYLPRSRLFSSPPSHSRASRCAHPSKLQRCSLQTVQTVQTVQKSRRAEELWEYTLPQHENSIHSSQITKVKTRELYTNQPTWSEQQTLDFPFPHHFPLPSLFFPISSYFATLLLLTHRRLLYTPLTYSLYILNLGLHSKYYFTLQI